MLITRVWLLVDYLPVVWIVSQLWSDINCQTPGYEIRTAPYVRVQRGLCARVPCTFTVPRNIRLSRNTDGFWNTVRGQTTVRVASRENSRYSTNGRFHLIGDVSRGDCSFYIEDPLNIDEGQYHFSIVDPTTKYNYPNILPYVAVTNLTEKPTISSTRLLDGKEVTMTCTSPGRCWNITQPRISWEGAMAGTRQMIYNTTYEDGSRTFHSNITFTPRKTHNNSPLSCRVSFNQDLSTMEKQILNVEYSPSINITTKGIDTNDTTSVIVEDGDSVTLQCIVDSNPKTSVTWIKEDTVLHGNINDQTATIQLIAITERDAGRYQCFAMNEHGVTHRSIHIMYQNTDEGSKLIVLLSTIGAICLLLLALLAYACWRKRQKNSRSAETEATYTDLRRSEITDTYDRLQIEATYTDLRRSAITDTYDQLKPVTGADMAVVGSNVGAAQDYENVHKH